MKTIAMTTMLGVALLGAVPHAHAFGMGGRPGFFAGHGGPGGPGGAGGPAGLPLRLLVADMTPTQRRQVRQILADSRSELRDILSQMRAAHEALGDRMFTPGALTDKDVQADTQRIAALHQRLLDHGTKVMLQVRAVATPDQLAKAAQTKKRLGELHDEIRTLLGKGPGDDDGPAPEDAGQ